MRDYQAKHPARHSLCMLPGVGRTSVCEVSSCSSPFSFFSGSLVFLARCTMSSALPWSAVTWTPCEQMLGHFICSPMHFLL